MIARRRYVTISSSCSWSQRLDGVARQCRIERLSYRCDCELSIPRGSPCLFICIARRPGGKAAGLLMIWSTCEAFIQWGIMSVYTVRFLHLPTFSASIWSLNPCSTSSLLLRWSCSPSTCSFTIEISSWYCFRLCPVFALPSPFSMSLSSRLL